MANCSHTKTSETSETVIQDIPKQEIKPVEEVKEEPKQEITVPVEKKEPVAMEASFTTPKPDPKPKEEAKVEEPKKEEPKPTPPKKEEPKPEPKKEPPKKEEPKVVEKEPEKPVVDEEYTRSVAQMAEGQTVDVVTFNKDKEAVLALINDLNNVMQEQNYKEWLTYLDEDSKEYWSRKNNLKKAQKRLPVKGLSLNSLEDYFKYVFIPSRQGNQMDEIRYETESNVKAVQIRKDENGNYAGDTVFYYLRKISGTWKLHLPQM